MSGTDLSIYTNQDLQDLLAGVTEAFREIQRTIEVLPADQIPAGRLLHIKELKLKMTLYREELSRRGVLGPVRGKIKILFLAASPGNTAHLSIDEEISRIQKRLRSGEYRDQFELVQEMAVQVADIPEHLLHHKPTIVHFGGHANKQGELIGEDRSRLSKAIPVEILASLFGTLKSNIRCVVLNACYAAEQAKLIATHIECAIGMSTAVRDDAAVAFSETFYCGLVYGRSMKEAFGLACAAAGIQKQGQQEVPRLYASPGVHLESLVLTTASANEAVL